MEPFGAKRSRLVAGSLGVSLFLIPLYPAFIGLTGAPVPGISVLPEALTLALLGAVTLLAAFWAVALAASRTQPMPTLVPLAAFPGAALLAALLGFDPRAGALFIAILAGGVLWHATILRFVRDRGALASVFRAYLVSGALASLAAIVMVLAKVPAGLYTIGHGRATGTFVLPGELAGYLVVYVPVALALARARLGLRVLAAAGAALGAIAFALTFSRAGWVGMAAAIAALVLLRRRRGGARYAVAIMGTAVVVVLYAFNAHHDPSENFTRLSIWQAALRAVSRFPFSGVGPFEFARLYPLFRLPGGEPVAYHAHNVVLTIAAETGLTGVGVLLFGWWRFVAELRARLRGEPPFASIAVAIAAGLAGTWVQGLIDTVSVVLFGLWLPFMALALACAGAGAADVAPPDAERERDVHDVYDHPPYERDHGQVAGAAAPHTLFRVACTASIVLALLCAIVQLASSAVYAPAAAPFALPAHLPRQLATRVYQGIERLAPFPFVEEVLADDALRRGDVRRAAEHAARIPAGAIRSDLQARVAVAQGRPGEAIRLALDAGDDEALQPVVASLLRAGRIRDAYDLERRVRDRLAATGTRPNALADSWWRLGRLATRLGDAPEAANDYERAVALAPLNTKYLIDAGTLALERRDPFTADRLFARASEIDPADADAIAGTGLAALERGNRRTAASLSARADAINPGATLALRLRRVLHTAGDALAAPAAVSFKGRRCGPTKGA